MLPNEIKDLSHGGNIYWMHAEIGYEGTYFIQISIKQLMCLISILVCGMGSAK